MQKKRLVNLSSQNVKKREKNLSEGKSKFLKKYFSALVKPIEDECKVNMELEERSNTCIIRWKGFPKEFAKCKDLVEKLNEDIVEKNGNFALPGVYQLFRGKDNQKQLRLIEEAKMVDINPRRVRTSIRASKRAKRRSPSFSNAFTPANQKHSLGEGSSLIETVVTDPRTCSDNVIIFLKNGKIENEEVGSNF